MDRHSADARPRRIGCATLRSTVHGIRIAESLYAAPTHATSRPLLLSVCFDRHRKHWLWRISISLMFNVGPLHRTNDWTVSSEHPGFCFSSFLTLVCLVHCGRLSWLFVSFRRTYIYSISYRIVSYRRGVAVTSLGITYINEVTLRWARLVLGSVTVFGGQTTSVFHQATQANSASYPQRDGKWAPAKVRWCSAAG